MSIRSHPLDASEGDGPHVEGAVDEDGRHKVTQTLEQVSSEGADRDMRWVEP